MDALENGVGVDGSCSWGCRVSVIEGGGGHWNIVGTE